MKNMKKFVKSVLVFCCLMLPFSSAFAQSSILDSLKNVDVQELLRTYSSLNIPNVQSGVQSYARMRSTVHAETERVRIPDLSAYNGGDLAKEPKYYYIKNVGANMYLRKGDVAALEMILEPDDASKFFVQKHGLGLSTGNGSLHNFVCEEVFQSVLTNSWVKVTNGWKDDDILDPIVSFIPTEDGTGCYIVDEFIEDKGQVWCYDEETGAIVAGEKDDEYAVWVVEALPETPVVSTIGVDTVWYVVKNVDTGRYLHYEGTSGPMSLVKSPDPCSLFFVLDVDGVAGEEVELHNYEAGELTYSGANQWSTMSAPIQFVRSGTTDQFFIKENSGATVWNENSGTLAMGEAGVNSLWEFEKITDFKELFGLCYNGEQYNNIYNNLREYANSDNVNITQFYAMTLVSLICVLSTSANNVGIGKAEELKVALGTYDEAVKEAIPSDSFDDLKVYNVSYTDETTGDILIRSLSTNSSSLLINSVDYSHTNTWKILTTIENLDVDNIFGDNNDAVGYSVRLYNIVTKKYVTAPSKKGDVWTVGMTSNIEEAGYWFLVPKEVTLDNELYMSTSIESLDMPGYYLQLASPNDITPSCVEVDDVENTPGLSWVFTMSDALVDKNVYDHAAETTLLYPQTLQEKYGCVRDGQYYTSNFPSAEAGSSTDNLLDFDDNTLFWTDGTKDNGVKHYLQADLGAGKGLSEFYFYMRPNFESWQGVPVSITVSGSNSADTGFKELAKVEMPTLLYDLSYFSGLIKSNNGASYRYLRFTVDEVTGDVEREFALSEFYIFPNNPEVALGSEMTKNFLEEDYMGEGIISSSAEMIMKEAKYYLDLYKNNHAELPGVGQYPTSKYNALLEAYNAADVYDAESITNLGIALDEFIAAKLSFVCIIESAWEDGFSNGCAIGYNYDITEVQAREFNAWDMRQWVIIDRSGDADNPYSVEFVVKKGDVDKINFAGIEGWNTLYESHRNAYNIFLKFPNGNGYWTVVQDESGKKTVIYDLSPATTTQNKEAAWYLTVISNSDRVPRISDKSFIDALASFGKIFAQAKNYREGFENGQFLYTGTDVQWAEFEYIYGELEEFYEIGAVKLAEYYAKGELPNQLIDEVRGALMALQSHFPYFIVNSDASAIAGGYFRLRGRGTDGYLTSDAKGLFSVSSSSEACIYYTQAVGDEVSMMSFSSGRYVKANVDGSLEYDAIPFDGNALATQKVGLGISLSGTKGCNSIVFDDNLYLQRRGTSVGVSAGPTNYEECDWVVEILDKLPISISAAQYATLYVPVELKIPGGVTAYVLFDEATNSNNERVLRLKELQGGVIPAGLPVILQANEGVYNFSINYNPTLSSESAKRDTYCYDGDIENLLDGRHATTFISERAGYIHYILANGSKGVGMYKVKMDDATVGGVNYFQNNAHRAWLPNPATRTTGAAGYRFSVAGRGETTGIDAAIDDSADAEIYDLQGRRVSHMVKGVYIVNGKKVVK